MAVDLIFPGVTPDADDLLAGRGAQGDAVAFGELVSRYQPRLYRFAYRVLGDQSEAEDSVQETFLRVFKALPHYRPDGHFASWIYRIELNECRRRIRGRRNTVPLADTLPSDSNSDPQFRLMVRERSARVRAVVNALPNHYREVMHLFYFDDMSVDDIANTLSLTVSAVKVRLHRARLRMATRLDNML